MLNREFLKKRRTELEMTIEEVAHGVGISSEKYRKIEKGDEEPLPNLIVALSFILNVEAESLIENVQLKPYTKPDPSFDGDKLWKYRTSHEVSRQTLADTIGVNRKTVDNWEHCLMSPNEINRRAVESYFGLKKGFFDLEKEEYEK